MQTDVLRRGRTFHAVDVENLVGGSPFTAADVTSAAHAYLNRVGVSPGDAVVIACGVGNAFTVFFSWPGVSRKVVGSGLDGADRALLEVLLTENIPARFERVVIASGDGIFAPAASHLSRLGAEVVIASRPEALSGLLSADYPSITLPSVALVA